MDSTAICQNTVKTYNRFLKTKLARKPETWIRNNGELSLPGHESGQSQYCRVPCGIRITCEQIGLTGLATGV